MKVFVNYKNKTITENDKLAFAQGQNLANVVDIYVVNNLDKPYYIQLRFDTPDNRHPVLYSADVDSGEIIDVDGVGYIRHTFTLKNDITKVAGRLQISAFIIFTDGTTNDDNSVSRDVLFTSVNTIVKSTGYTEDTILLLESTEDGKQLIKDIRKFIDDYNIKINAESEARQEEDEALGGRVNSLEGTTSQHSINIAQLLAALASKADLVNQMQEITASKLLIDTIEGLYYGSLTIKADTLNMVGLDGEQKLSMDRYSGLYFLVPVSTDDFQCEGFAYINSLQANLSPSSKLPQMGEEDDSITNKLYVDSVASANHAKSAYVTVDTDTGTYTAHIMNANNQELFSFNWDTPDEYIIDTERDPLVQTQYDAEGKIVSQTTTIYLYGGKSFTIDTTSLALGGSEDAYVSIEVKNGKIYAKVSEEFKNVLNNEAQRITNEVNRQAYFNEVKNKLDSATSFVGAFDFTENEDGSFNLNIDTMSF